MPLHKSIKHLASFKKKKNLLSPKIFRACLVRAFWLLSFRHSSLITQNIPIFTTYRLDTVFTLHNSNISTFLWDPHLITESVSSVSLPALIPHFLHFSFPLHPFNRLPLPKPKPEPIKMRWSAVSSPRQCVPSPFQKLPHLTSFSSFRFETFSYLMLCC